MRKKEKWVSPLIYAKLIGKSKQQVYMDIRLKKVKSRKVLKKVKRLEILLPVDK